VISSHEKNKGLFDRLRVCVPVRTTFTVLDKIFCISFKSV
jgi:hypothetical protein